MSYMPTDNPEFHQVRDWTTGKWQRRKNRIFTKAFKGKNIRVWKKAVRTARGASYYTEYVIVEMVVHHKAQRRQPTNGKCRASSAKVVAIHGLQGKRYQRCHAHYDRKFLYRVGQTVRPVKPFDPENRMCRSGIHFFLTRAEAENYCL